MDLRTACARFLKRGDFATLKEALKEVQPDSEAFVLATSIIGLIEDCEWWKRYNRFMEMIENGQSRMTDPIKEKLHWYQIGEYYWQLAQTADIEEYISTTSNDYMIYTEYAKERPIYSHTECINSICTMVKDILSRIDVNSIFYELRMNKKALERARNAVKVVQQHSLLEYDQKNDMFVYKNKFFKINMNKNATNPALYNVAFMEGFRRYVFVM